VPQFIECKPPDLSDLAHPLIRDYWTNLMFRGAGLSGESANSYLHNFLAAVDKAVGEYEGARRDLIAYQGSSNRTHLLIAALGRFETSVHSIRRSMRFLERLRTLKTAPTFDRPLVRLLASYERDLTPVRDLIEHADEYIDRGEIKKGQPVMLLISDDMKALEIGALRLAFDRLAKLLRRLHGVAAQLCDVREGTEVK
jgi:hypothetical protein